MDSEVKIWLHDIIKTIEEIESYFIGHTKKFSNFKKDIKTIRAVERGVEIIGEALNRISKLKSDIEISNYRKIIDTRNRIIHEYDKVSEDILWNIVIKHIPLLKKEVISILKK